jgi:DNA-binding response OmpR family regulator
MALKWGADDYCKKPILAKEFIARVTALGRRIGTNLSQSTQPVEICGYLLNPGKHTVEIDGKTIALSEIEFRLAHYMFSRLNSPIARGTLLNEVWGRTDAEMTRTLDVHMTWIRKKLNIGASGQVLRLSAIYGYGYRLSEISE